MQDQISQIIFFLFWSCKHTFVQLKCYWFSRHFIDHSFRIAGGCWFIFIYDINISCCKISTFWLTFKLLVQVCLCSLNNVLFLQFDQITLLHFCLVHHFLVTAVFFEIHCFILRGYIKIYGAFFNILWQLVGWFRFTKTGTIFTGRSSQLSSTMQWPVIWLTNNDYNCDKNHLCDMWHHCVHTNRGPDLSMTWSSLIGFIYKTTTAQYMMDATKSQNLTKRSSLPIS